jgi:hypothetical protein
MKLPSKDQCIQWAEEELCHCCGGKIKEGKRV